MSFLGKFFAKKQEKKSLFQKYEPQTEHREFGRVAIEQMTLLNTEDEIQKTGIVVSEIAKFTNGTVDKLTELVEKTDEQGAILMQVEISTEIPKIQLSFQGNISQGNLQELYEFLVAQPTKTKQGIFTFQFELHVREKL